MPLTRTSTPAASLTWKQAIAWRACRHRLVERAPRRERLGVVSALCGVHAQVMSSAELRLWARVDGPRRDDVKRALWHDRSLVKIWAMRGTLHLIPTSEYPIWQSALATYDHFLRPSWSQVLRGRVGQGRSDDRRRRPRTPPAGC
jgi:winged helix DNA-binding protein